MYQKPSAVFYPAMPSPEIIRTVHAVQHPFKVNAVNLSYRPFCQQLLNLFKMRHIAAVKGNPHIFASSFSGIQNLIQLDFIYS